MSSVPYSLSPSATPLPTRSGSRSRICGASGGGNAPHSAGSAARGCASSPARYARHPPGVTPSTPLRSAATASSEDRRAAIRPHSPNIESSASSTASWRGARLSSPASAHCDSPVSGSHAFSRFFLSLPSFFLSTGPAADGRVQHATSRLSSAGGGRRERSAITSDRSRPSRSPFRLRDSHAASRTARSSTRSKVTCSAWPRPVNLLFSRRAAMSTNLSSSPLPARARDPSIRNSDTSEQSRQSSHPSAAATGIRKHSSGFRRASHQNRCRSSRNILPPRPTAAAAGRSPPPVAPNVSATPLITAGRSRSPTPTQIVISAEPSPTCCGWSKCFFTRNTPTATIRSPTM